MKLRVSSTSPFVRKVSIFAIEAGLESRIESVPTQAWSPDTDLPKDNPLGKIPTLIADDGTSVYDSHVICEYLDTLHGGKKLIPAGPGRIAQLTLHAMADGILEAGVAIRIETAVRPKEFQWQGWVDRQMAAITRSLDQLEKECQNWGDDFLIGQIAVATALGYVDFRLKLNWREGRPNLAAWEAKVAKRPSLAQTLPTD